MQISINEISNGIGLLINGEVYLVTEYSHVKPGKGSAFVRVRIKNLKTDAVLERTFRSAETLEEVNLEERRFQFTYKSGNDYHFMDQTSYEEVTLTAEQIGEGVKYLQENGDVTAILYNNQVLKVLLPNFIITKVVESEPGIKGDSSRSGTKPATIDTGAIVQVPLFIGAGEVIKVDTRSGIYVERVKQ